MEYAFSKSSLERRDTLHPDLQNLVDEILKFYDCSVLCGHRDKKEQDEAFENKKSHVKWPNSKHNAYPSLAVDLALYPVKYKDDVRNVYFGGFVMGIAKNLKEDGHMDHSLIWGGNFNDNDDFHDQTLIDYMHFQLVV